MRSLAVEYRRATALAYRLQKIVAFLTAVLEKGLFWFASALLIFLVVVLFAQVFYRYMLEQPLAWSEEAARFGLVWLSMAAACLAAIEGQHFIFRWATLALPERARLWLGCLTDALIACVLVAILKLSLDYLDIVAGQTAPGTGLDMQVAYGAISFGAASLMTIFIAEILDALLSLKTGQTLSKRKQHEARLNVLLRGPQIHDRKGS